MSAAWWGQNIKSVHDGFGRCLSVSSVAKLSRNTKNKTIKHRQAKSRLRRKTNVVDAELSIMNIHQFSSKSIPLENIKRLAIDATNNRISHACHKVFSLYLFGSFSLYFALFHHHTYATYQHLIVLTMYCIFSTQFAAFETFLINY